MWKRDRQVSEDEKKNIKKEDRRRKKQSWGGKRKDTKHKKQEEEGFAKTNDSQKENENFGHCYQISFHLDEFMLKAERKIHAITKKKSNIFHTYIYKGRVSYLGFFAFQIRNSLLIISTKTKKETHTDIYIMYTH